MDSKSDVCEDSCKQHIAILGLNQVGKTVIGNYLTTGIQRTDFRPTLAINFGFILFNQVKFQIVDYPGQKSLRHTWNKCIDAITIIIFVVDAADPARIVEVNKELKIFLENPNLEKKKCSVLFLYHKIDLPKAQRSIEEITPFFNEEFFRENGIHDIHFFRTSIHNPSTLDNVRDKIGSIILKELFNESK